MRFNDTLKLELIDDGSVRRNLPPRIRVTKVTLAENSPVPVPRTYHAACQLQNYMAIIGGESSADLGDLWLLDLDNRIWY